MLAHCEAYIDFEADELADPRLATTFIELTKDVKLFKQKIQSYIEKAQIAEVIREGFKISILGPPNAGKSTLMNMLAKRRVAIVSDIPGTTRDLLQTNLNLFGYNVILSDTAGLRETTDDIEYQGIEMAKEESSKSHGIVFILDINQLKPVKSSQNDNVYEITDSIVSDQL